MGTRMEVAQLEERMNIEDYRKLQGLFLDSSGSPRSMSRTEFVDLAWSSVGRGSEEEYGLLFDSVVFTQEHSGLLLDVDAIKEEERVDWGGLSSFLLQELSDKVKNSRTRSGPRWKPVRTLTCPHRDPVQKRGHVPPAHTSTANSTVKPKDLWVTDMVLLHNVHKGLIFTPWCLDYWVDPSDPDQAVLTIGDIGGQVSALYFTSAQISLFERLNVRMDSDSADIIQWDELVRGKHCSCYTVTHRAHTPAWVRKVRYLGSLEAFVSCSTQPQSSVVIGWREKESRSLRVTSFFTKRGVWDIDHHRELNLIATAGVDHQVLLWNPCVTSGPVCVLSGHTGPVTAVRFMQAEQQLISYSKDKVLCLWDISRQLCVHRLAGVFPKTQEDTHTLLLFRQAVSSDSASSVICWRVDTGQKVKQFRRCHGDAEISTMALDGTQTRLFTAGADGEVKVWDFNGRCLHRMNAGLGRSVDISQVLLLRRSVLVMGWDRMFTVFRLHSFSQSYVEPSEWKGGVQHRSDVLCAAFQPPQTLILILVRMEKKMLITPSPSLDCSLYRDAHLKAAQTWCPVEVQVWSDSGTAPTAVWWGQFTAHNSDLGSIVMTHYYLELRDGITDEPPKLLSSFRPHLDRVMHLKTCLHGNRLLVLSASSDCSVALSYLRGDNEEQWCLERTGPLHPQQEAERKPREEGGERSPPNETLPDPGPSAGGGEGGVKDEGEDCGSIAGDSRKHLSR
ncbi:hypothetical protein KUCAC02_005294 [Chaenocephalus aceratus]|uniref:Uncharacterized protein n=1 Tax=Chaenocephalus aceratus TaxID=36190 RepID=A0ACB9WPM4_CHAAC|nr:hypothetical protein KUCAC02_005294 [Chaenocephalus aceratus]